MDIINKKINLYAEAHSDPESELLKLLNRETHLKVLLPRMLSGHLQGRTLSMISKMIKPKHILEIGTFTGYSALCLAEGLDENGQITTIDINSELEHFVTDFFEKSEFKSKINYIIGNAMDIVPELNSSFDLVFIDADKKNNKNYFNMVIDKVTKGGIILIDNVLWSGKVVDEKYDKDTENIREFNNFIQNDGRVENLLLPIRDGIMICRKK